MSTDYGALADYLIALADQMGDGYTTDDDVVTIERIRAAAAALRALVAERDDALDALECMCDERAGIPSVVAAARALLARHGRET